MLIKHVLVVFVLISSLLFLLMGTTSLVVSINGTFERGKLFFCPVLQLFKTFIFMHSSNTCGIYGSITGLFGNEKLGSVCNKQWKLIRFFRH